MRSGVVSTPYPPRDWNWTPGTFGANAFGIASKAMNLIGANWAMQGAGPVPSKRSGKGVNVVIVDVGLNEEYIRSLGGNFRKFKNLYHVPGRYPQGEYIKVEKTAYEWHGSMIARNILRLAPDARIYDAPLLPKRVVWVENFAKHITELYASIEKSIDQSGRACEPWVIVNAWSVADTIQDYDTGLKPDKMYITGELNRANEIMNRLAQKYDIILAAGNYGEFAPGFGAGLYDTGPERSIRGSNAIGDVLTVAACNTQGQWYGGSSQGDGPESLRYCSKTKGKPDLAAPASFSEDFDARQLSSGSSASCAVAAGLVASLRTDMQSQTPAELFDLLREKALNTSGTGWTRRTGHGILQSPV